MSKRAMLMAATLVAAAGCARKQEVRKELMAMNPVVLPTAMCAEQGNVSYSKDKEGDRMVCEMQNILGSHISPGISVWGPVPPGSWTSPASIGDSRS